MRKGLQTRERILDRAAELFNQQGYFGASVSDIMKATGLEKGGIYNHFHGKEELALEAFDYAVNVIWQSVVHELEGKTNAIDRLSAIINAYRKLVDEPPIPGGCPILNTAIESDDAHPILRDHTRVAMTRWQRWIIKNLNRGIAAGEVRSDTDPEVVATILISGVEGAVMMSKLYDDSIYLQRACDHLISYLDALRA